MEECKRCESTVEPVFKLRPDTPHYGSEVCPKCNFMIRWVKKPKNKDKRNKNKYTAKSKGIDRCSMCSRSVDMLGKNEVIDCHHIVELQHGGKDVLSNIWWVCTSCHKEIHHRRTYFMQGHIDKFSLENIYALLAGYNIPESTKEILVRIFEKSQKARNR